MEGIMVLNTIDTPVYAFGWNNWCFLLIIPILIAVYLITFAYSNRRLARARRWGVIGAIILTLSLTFGIAICSTENVSYERTYQVIIDNNVDMEQFRQNYEILEQVGITYMIKHK